MDRTIGPCLDSSTAFANVSDNDIHRFRSCSSRSSRSPQSTVNLTIDGCHWTFEAGQTSGYIQHVPFHLHCKNFGGIGRGKCGIMRSLKDFRRLSLSVIGARIEVLIPDGCKRGRCHYANQVLSEAIGHFRRQYKSASLRSTSTSVRGILRTIQPAAVKDSTWSTETSLLPTQVKCK
jgi:hypothetical protein